MKKAIFLDIDGTLIDCMGGIKDITPNVKKAIKKFKKKETMFLYLQEDLLHF